MKKCFSFKRDDVANNNIASNTSTAYVTPPFEIQSSEGIEIVVDNVLGERDLEGYTFLGTI